MQVRVQATDAPGLSAVSPGTWLAPLGPSAWLPRLPLRSPRVPSTSQGEGSAFPGIPGPFPASQRLCPSLAAPGHWMRAHHGHHLFRSKSPDLGNS